MRTIALAQHLLLPTVGRQQRHLCAGGGCADSGERRSCVSTAVMVALRSIACRNSALLRLSSRRWRNSSTKTSTLLSMTRGSIGLYRKSTAPAS